MIEITLKEIVDSIDLLTELSTRSLKTKAAYQLGRILREAQKEFSLYNEKRIALLEKYADKDEEGKPVIENGNYKISDEGIAAINTEYNELIETTVALNANKLQLYLLDDETFTPTEMLKLMPFVEE